MREGAQGTETLAEGGEGLNRKRQQQQRRVEYNAQSLIMFPALCGGCGGLKLFLNGIVYLLVLPRNECIRAGGQG